MMSAYWRQLCAFATVLCTCLSTVASPPQLGYLYKEHIYVLFPNDNDLLRAGKDHSQNFTGRTVEYHLSFSGPQWATYRLSIAYGQVWVIRNDGRIRRTPIDELDLYNLDNPKRHEKLGLKYPRHRYISGFGCHLWLVPPVIDAAWREVQDTLQDTPARAGWITVGPVTYDFLPTSPTTGKAFVPFARRRGRPAPHPDAADWNSGLAVWQGKGIWDADRQDWDTDFGKQPVEWIQGQFGQPFSVFAKGDDYFFLTDTGSLFIATKRSGVTRTLEVVWQVAQRPITAVVCDADRGATWFCGPDKGAPGRHFWFALDRQPSARVINAGQLPEPCGEEPLRTVLPYARYLTELHRREGLKAVPPRDQP